MKLSPCALFAALTAGAAAQVVAQEHKPMTTRPAVLRKRELECVEDACLEAIQQSDFCTCIRLGTRDCSSYWTTTYTSETVTVYKTAFSTQTSYSTESRSTITTVPATSTTTETITPTVTVYESKTVGVAPTPDAKRRYAGSKKKKKRGYNPMPYYVKGKCTNVPAYQSACACVGVHSTRVWVDAPTTTVTVTLPAYSPTDIHTVTETATTTAIFSTKTSITTAPTATATSVVTAVGPFWLQVLSQDDTSINSVVGLFGESTSSQALSFNNPDRFGTVSLFFVDTDGYLRTFSIIQPDPPTWYTVEDGGGDGNDLTELSEPISGFTPVRCKVTPLTNVLSCGTSDVSAINFRTCGSSVAYTAPTTWGNTDLCTTIKLVAVPFSLPR